MKYLEELESGESFVLDSKYFIVTTDFKSSGKRLCYNLTNGNPQWIEPNIVVALEPIYVMDKENNVLPIRNYANKDKNFS